MLCAFFSGITMQYLIGSRGFDVNKRIDGIVLKKLKRAFENPKYTTYELGQMLSSAMPIY